jgi:hypothetical protein
MQLTLGNCSPFSKMGREDLLYGHPCRRRACETEPWLTAERVGLMVQHQVVLMCRKLTRMQSGVNLPLSEVIMSRCSKQPEGSGSSFSRTLNI